MVLVPKYPRHKGIWTPTFTSNDLYRPLRKLHSRPANGFKGKCFRPWLLLVLLREFFIQLQRAINTFPYCCRHDGSSRERKGID